MITNRKSTMIAPAYTSTCSTAMNWASSSTNRAASENSVATSHSALATGLRRVMQSPALAIASTAKPPNRIRVPSMLLALGVRGVPQRRDGVRLGAQPLEVVHEPVARKLRVLVVHAHVDRLFGAHFLAIAAEHAAEFVDFVDERVAVARLVLPGHELDAVGRADLGAETACDALGASLLVGEHAVGAAPPRGERPVLTALLLGILHRHLGPEQVLEGEGHPLERRPQVRHLRAGPFHHLHADRHQASATEPAMM